MLGDLKEGEMPRPRLTYPERTREGAIGNVVKVCGAGHGGQEGLTDQGKNFRLTPNGRREVIGEF